MNKVFVSAAAALLVLLAIWMGVSLGQSAPPSSNEALAGGQPMTGDLGTEPAAFRTPLPEAPPVEAQPFSGRLFHHDGRPAVGVPYGAFPDGPDRPEWTRAPESPVYLRDPPPYGLREWYPSAATTDDGGWILPAGMTPPAVVSFEVDGVHVASFEISPESHDLILPELVSVEVYLSGYTAGDKWSIVRAPFPDDGRFRRGFPFGHFVRDAGSCVLAISMLEENLFFHCQGDSLSIPALRGQKMAIAFVGPGVDPQNWLVPEVTAPEIVTFSVKERRPVITVELLEWDQGPRAKLLVEADTWPEKSPPDRTRVSGLSHYLAWRSPDGVAQWRVEEPETDMRLVLRTEEGESFSTNFRMKQGEMSQTISFIRGKGSMAEEILLPVGASMDSVMGLQVEFPSRKTGDLEWTSTSRGGIPVDGIHEFGTIDVLLALEPTLYRTAQGLLVGDLPKGWAQMILTMKDSRVARVLPGLPLRANWIEPLEILLPEGVSADQVHWRRGMTVQYPNPRTTELIWRTFNPLSPSNGLPSPQHLRLSDIPEGWTQILLLVDDEERRLGRFARVLPESLPLRAQWLPDHPLAPIDLKALSEAQAPDSSWGAFSFTLEPWGSHPMWEYMLMFQSGPDTKKWPVWKLRVPEGIPYQLWLHDRSWQKLPAPRLR